jgi:hypothetical protein
MAFYKNDVTKLVNLMLTYMNAIQSLYHYKSLGRKIDFVIVRLELHSSVQFGIAEGEREGILTSFCHYQVITQ